MSGEAGKGSRQRPTDKKAFDEAFDRIFRKKPDPVDQKKERKTPS